MGIFSKLFGSERERAAKLAQKLATQGGPKLRALWNLTYGIVNAADECTRIIKPLVQSNAKAFLEADLHRNFVFFFMHLTQRSAFHELGLDKRERLTAIIGPFVASMAINTYWLRASEQLKEQMRSEFFEHLNESEEYYAACSQLICEGENPLKANSCFSALARNVADVCGMPDNFIAVSKVYCAALEAYVALNLNELIRRAASALL